MFFKIDDVTYKKDKELRTYATEIKKQKLSSEESIEILSKGKETLRILQDKFYAYDKYALLIIFQAMDAGGKDSMIKHVMSGVNPQGCQVKSFKRPSGLELDHDYLWRCNNALPERGNIGIFNRSYYEEVLITRVHPEIIAQRKIPGIQSVKDIDDAFWEKRYQEIMEFENRLINNGTEIIKFFLNISKEEQKQRFLKRLNRADKHWKFEISDIEERKFWNDYQKYYEVAFKKTSHKKAPWYIIPADRKKPARAMVAEIIIERMKKLEVTYPKVKPQQKEDLVTGKIILEKE